MRSSFQAADIPISCLLAEGTRNCSDSATSARRPCGNSTEIRTHPLRGCGENNARTEMTRQNELTNKRNKKAVLSQRWPRNAPHIWVPWKFSGLPGYAHGYFSQKFSWAFVPIHPKSMCVQNLMFVALPDPGIIGGNQKNWAVAVWGLLDELA